MRVSPDCAFALFTEELDSWWRHGAKYRIAGNRPGTLILEARLGGRVFETYERRSAEHVHVIGTITDWCPPERFAFEWQGINFKPNERTLVEVTFTPSASGTVVEVTHSGFASLPADHPVRHGASARDFCRDMGLWWGGLLTALREYTNASKDSAATEDI